MTQNFTILFDLDGTLVDTAPDLMHAHNHVMKKFGHKEKKLSDIKSLAGKGAWVMMQRSFRQEIENEKLKKEMTKEFVDFYSQNIDRGSKPINGVMEFSETLIPYKHDTSWIEGKVYEMITCINSSKVPKNNPSCEGCAYTRQVFNLIRNK